MQTPKYSVMSTVTKLKDENKSLKERIAELESEKKAHLDLGNVPESLENTLETVLSTLSHEQKKQYLQNENEMNELESEIEKLKKSHGEGSEEFKKLSAHSETQLQNLSADNEQLLLSTLSPERKIQYLENDRKINALDDEMEKLKNRLGEGTEQYMNEASKLQAELDEIVSKNEQLLLNSQSELKTDLEVEGLEEWLNSLNDLKIGIDLDAATQWYTKVKYKKS